MKCPLLAHKTYIRDDYPMQVFEECLKEECAWWEQDLYLCAIKEMALELRYTQLRLADIRDKLKPELFPTH